MTKEDFFNNLLKQKKAKIRKYKSSQETNPDDCSWEIHNLYLMSHKGKITLIGIAEETLTWAEMNPNYDLANFDGKTMIFVVDDFVTEVQLIGD